MLHGTPTYVSSADTKTVEPVEGITLPSSVKRRSIIGQAEVIRL